MLHRLRHILFATIVFALIVLTIHLFYVRKYNLKDTAIHIVQSFKFDLKGERLKEENKHVDPHGNENLEQKNTEVVKPQELVVTKPPVKLADNEKPKIATKEKDPIQKIPVTEKPVIASSKPPEPAKVENKKEPKKSSENWCEKRGKNLVGPMAINQSVPDMERLVKKYSVPGGGGVEKGGWWKPKECNARVKSAIIIPYRKREEQLKIFLRHMHPVLQRQQLHYRIFVIEQADNDPFNRAGLFNIGFKEALKFENFDCFVFSDVDLMPEDDRNYYGCPTSPRHMSVAIDKFDYRLPYEGIFGGVGSFKKEHFEKINGFSNKFWGWGGEDDDLFQRISAKGFRLTRPSMTVGRYRMILVHHFQSHQANPNRMNLLQDSRSRMVEDGLNDLKYKVNRIIELPLVTFVNVKLAPALYNNNEIVS